MWPHQYLKIFVDIVVINHQQWVGKCTWSGYWKVLHLKEPLGTIHISIAVADPGFPVGGRGPRGGGAMFHKICMLKRKNWVFKGGCMPGAPLHLPMNRIKR